jgi:predicted ester cyclase
MVDTKARAKAFWDELFNAHDLGRVEDFIAAGSVNHNARAGTPNGPAGAREIFERLWTGFPDMRFDVAAMVAEGDKVACIGTMTGTHDGPFQGMEPTHKQTSARHIHVLTFDGAGLIVDHLAVRDDIAMLRQIGAIGG